jgi:hypothetical protein
MIWQDTTMYGSPEQPGHHWLEQVLELFRAAFQSGQRELVLDPTQLEVCIRGI